MKSKEYAHGHPGLSVLVGMNEKERVLVIYCCMTTPNLVAETTNIASPGFWEPGVQRHLGPVALAQPASGGWSQAPGQRRSLLCRLENTEIHPVNTEKQLGLLKVVSG